MRRLSALLSQGRKFNARKFARSSQFYAIASKTTPRHIRARAINFAYLISLAGAYRANVMRVLTHQFPNLRRHCIFANRARGRSQNRPQMLQSGTACCFAIHTTVLVVRGRVSRAKCEHAGWALFSICNRNPLMGDDPLIPCHVIIKIPG